MKVLFGLKVLLFASCVTPQPISVSAETIMLNHETKEGTVRYRLSGNDDKSYEQQREKDAQVKMAMFCTGGVFSVIKEEMKEEVTGSKHNTYNLFNTGNPTTYTTQYYSTYRYLTFRCQ